MSILYIILILSFLVIIHELGHFLAAKWAKVKVEEFGLGYPPKVATLFRFWGTDFSLNWIPFGGFVRMEGEDGEKQPNLVEQVVSKVAANREGPFYTKSATKRLVIILAGATVNFVFGIIAFSIVFSFSGIPTFVDSALIGRIAPDSPAAEQGIPTNVELIGLRTGDERFAITNVEQAIEVINQHRGQTVNIQTGGTCQDGACQELLQEFEVYLRTAEETPDDQGSLGVSFETVQFSFYPWYEMPFRGMWYGTQQALMLGLLILNALGGMLYNLIASGQVPSEVAGPVGIVHQTQQSGILEQGFLSILNFAGMLSINLAVMNVLPIPALDGGRAVFILLEKVLGRSRTARAEQLANYGGYILLLSLIVLVTIKDVIALIT
jgi:regulator of sigma E protease